MNIIVTSWLSILSNMLNEDFYKFSTNVYREFNLNDTMSFKDDIRELNNKPSTEVEISTDVDEDFWGSKEENLKKYIMNWLSKIDIKSEFFKKISAEVSLISSLSLDKDNDDIYLFYSDSLAWQLVSEILLNLFKNKLWIKNVKIKKISWFINQLEAIKSNWNETIMCPVWWYRSTAISASIWAHDNNLEIKLLDDDWIPFVNNF
jgi:hypothetical protein